MSLKKVKEQAQKEFGSGIVKGGQDFVEYSRVPTGIFPFDLAMGGGFPQGKVSMVVGPESSGKTNIMLRTIKMVQMLFPNQTPVLVDAEHSFDPIWAKKMGVDVDNLEVFQPIYAEQAVNMVEGLAYATDCSFIGIDSVAALAPENEVESDAGKAAVGGNSMVVGKMMRKLTAAMLKMADQEHYPTVMLLNQIRFKIGTTMGNPETFPGGMALRHYCNVIARTYGKDVVKEAVSKDKPTYKETSVVLKKWKCPIVATNCKYQMAMIPHEGLSVGDVYDWNTVSARAKDQGLIAKDKSSWYLYGEEFKTLTAIQQHLMADPLEYQNLRARVMENAVKESDLPAKGDVK